MAFKEIRDHESDTYPRSEDQLRHLYRNRHENGLAPAFTKVQGRVLFDPDRLTGLLAERADAEAAAHARRA